MLWILTCSHLISEIPPVSLSVPLINSISIPEALISSQHWARDLILAFGTGSAEGAQVLVTAFSLHQREKDGGKEGKEKEDRREIDSLISKDTNLNMRFLPSEPHLNLITFQGNHC